MSSSSRPASEAIGGSISRWLWGLESRALRSAAQRRTGLSDFGAPSLDPVLPILVDSLEREAGLHALGRFLMRVHLRDLLETRLRLTEEWRKKAASLHECQIQSPVFIIGMPRSGSTFLHELLAEDPENRAPRVWEVMFPVAGRRRAVPDRDPRVRKARMCLWWFRRLAPGADSVYPMRAWTPHECVAIHSYTLFSEEFVSTCQIPTYETFLRSTDLTPTYLWQKRFLQYLQLGGPARRWVLKSPDHVYRLAELLSVFPDARIIQTHRNPVEVLSSSTELTRVLHGLYGRPMSHDQILEREARVLADGTEHFMRFRDQYPELSDRFIDVKYTELVADPLETVRRVYQQLDITLSSQTADRMQQLAANRSRYRRRHVRTQSQRVQAPIEASLFQRYCSRFGLSSKGGL